MSTTLSRGMVYRCPVCGAELLVVAHEMGRFAPQCCNRDMVRLTVRAVFYVCPVCGAELAVLNPGLGEFLPRCCNTAMDRRAA
jgi:hypothetical protein